MSAVTTHVLDTAKGMPAAGVTVVLEQDGTALATATTDADGRAADLGPDEVATGVYRLRFDTGAYFTAQGITAFYPEVLVSFEVADAGRHYHVPLLLSPFGYSTYRGS